MSRIAGKYTVEPDTGCWIWNGVRSRDRYGKIKVQGKFIQAHRQSWSERYGPIPDGHHMCHRCDTPACVNPDHLFPGTDKQNSQDALRKNRLNRWSEGQRNGEGNPRAKLKNDDVKAIRSVASQGLMTTSRLARAYDVSPSTIRNIVLKQRWTHLQERQQ